MLPFIKSAFRETAREVVRFGSFRFSAAKLSFIWSGAFLRSDDWKRLRYRAIKRFGGRCMACGHTPKQGRLNVDHIRPRRFYPELALRLDNLQVLCADCNRGKGNLDSTDWRKK